MDTVALVLGSTANGLAAYGYVALGTRTYGGEVFAPVSVVWTFWALSAAVFTFPVQHWIIRIVRLEGSEGSVRRTLPRLAVAATLVAAALFLIAVVLRERLFGSPSLWWPLLVPIVSLGSAGVGYGRGILAGRRRFVATGIAIGAENMLRLILGIVVVAAGAGVEWFGATLATGVLVVLLWPSTLRLRGDGRTHPVLEFVAGLGGGILLAQVALNAPPAIVALMGGGAAAVTGVFATLALFRAPYLVGLGFATRITGPLTARVAAGDEVTLARLRNRLVAASVGLGVVGAVGGWLIGPSVVDVVFGAGVSPDGGVVAAISAGSGLALGSLGLILILLARDATMPILRSWAIGSVIGLAALAWPGADAVDRVAAAFLVTEIAAFVLMIGVDRRLGSRILD